VFYNTEPSEDAYVYTSRGQNIGFQLLKNIVKTRYIHYLQS